MAKLFRSVSVRGFVLTMHSTRICVCVSVSKRGKTIQGHTEWNDFSLALSCSLCREGIGRERLMLTRSTEPMKAMMGVDFARIYMYTSERKHGTSYLVSSLLILL